MKKMRKLSTGQVAFVVGTRAALASGIGLLVSTKLPKGLRRGLGIALVAVGALTTIPAVRTVLGR